MISIIDANATVQDIVDLLNDVNVVGHHILFDFHTLQANCYLCSVSYSSNNIVITDIVGCKVGKATFDASTLLSTVLAGMGEIATTEQAFNVINASDIVSNTLTQAQYDLITNGKPTRIIGTFINLINPILYSGYATSSYYFGTLQGYYNGEYQYLIYYINLSTKAITIDSSKITFNLANNQVILERLYKINGKNIPNYPTLSTGDINKQLIYKDDNTMAWDNVSGFRVMTATEWSALSVDNRIAQIKKGLIIDGTLIVSGGTLKNPIFLPPVTTTSAGWWGLVIDGEQYEANNIRTYSIGINATIDVNSNWNYLNLLCVSQLNGVSVNKYYKKPQSSVSLSDGDTITDSALKTLIQNEQPIKLNGFTCYFSCDDGTNYQYVSTRYDSSANKNHINVITINKSTWVATFHTSDIAIN